MTSNGPMATQRLGEHGRGALGEAATNIGQLLAGVRGGS
jgi:hypothetical protein